MKALPALFAALAGVACAPSSPAFVCAPPDGTFLATLELRAGNATDCGGRLQEGVLSYEDGRARGSTTVCTGYTETSPSACDREYAEDCTAEDEHGPYTLRRIGSISQTASDTYEGVVQAEYMDYLPYTFTCVFDLTLVRQ
jgi:hypothetical protein